MTVGSICSGIEAATVAWSKLGFKFEWYSEIADFPKLLLKEKYNETINVGNMLSIKEKLEKGEINSVDIICGGTPCQAYSTAGNRQGLRDERGQLILEFVKIADMNDKIRGKRGIVFWENVEGVLSDKTNAFGQFICELAGVEIINKKKWESKGYIEGSKRKVAWKVLDSKNFGVPQQRKRVYVVAGGKDFNPQVILDIKGDNKYTGIGKKFEKDGHTFEVFRDYTDCLYSAYGTKWNGNAAALNGSLFVVEDGKLRRFQPIECERLMGFPDNYTNIINASKTKRYKALGNSWCVPIIEIIGERIQGYLNEIRNKVDIEDIISHCEDESLYISEKGIQGILRRNKGKLNKRLEEIMRGSKL